MEPFQPMTLDALYRVLTVVHFLSLGFLALYGLHRVVMMLAWVHGRNKERAAMAGDYAESGQPFVTVQLPLFNESLVAARLINAAAAFAWPRDRLEIQILDDSTDRTKDIVAERTLFWTARGVSMSRIGRSDRRGYKAGALANGLKQCRGEFVAVFDADFVPRPDFLQRLMPYFTDPNVGMVQARWSFLNTTNSWLTRLQALLLSAHFGVEHRVRHARGLFFNFNGTAGIWRKNAIVTAGGWQPDTVTEDLDLSYRAQMAGWRFEYVDDVTVPSELPLTLADFRSQQERWIKGSVQTAKKLLPRLLASHAPLKIKLEAMAHLLANFCWPAGFIAALTLYPVLCTRVGIGIYQMVWIDFPLFLLTGIAVMLYYFLYGLKTGQTSALAALPILPAVSIGLAPFFSLAVLKGMFLKGGMFKRTPKFGVLDKDPVWHPVVQVNPQTLFCLLANIPLCLYTLSPVFFAWQRGTWPAVPFLLFFPFGFFMVALLDLRALCAGFVRLRT